MKNYNRRPQRQKEWGRKPKKPSGPPPFDVLMRRFKKKVESSDYLTIIGSSLNKKNDNCMITSLGQKINLSSSGWDSFSEDN